MKTLLCYILVLCGMLQCIAGRRHHGPQVNRLPVTLYYEALCPYCMEFVTDQLNPSMVRKDRLPFTELTLVPYGNAKRDKRGNITCQHGEAECELNAWHGCILEHHDTVESLKLIACMMRGRKNKLDRCAAHYKIDVTAVKECKRSRSVNDILGKYADETDKVRHSGVPAIAIANILDDSEQERLVEDFGTVFCEKYEKMFNKKLDNC